MTQRRIAVSGLPGAVRTGVWLFPDAPSPAIVDAARAAEEAGLDEFWLGDEGVGRDPFVLLAAAAMVTERILLGVAVTNPYLRHPAATAAAAATVHELSGGRVVLGIGTGGDLALGPVGIVPRAAVRPRRRCRSGDARRHDRRAGRRLRPAAARAAAIRRTDLHRRPQRTAQPPRLVGRRRRVPRWDPARFTRRGGRGGRAAFDRSRSPCT